MYEGGKWVEFIYACLFRVFKVVKGSTVPLENSCFKIVYFRGGLEENLQKNIKFELNGPRNINTMSCVNFGW